MAVETTQEWKIDERGCLHLLPEIPDNSVDLIITDLPYGSTACEWDCPIELTRLWPEYERIIKDNGAIILTATQPFASLVIMSNLKLFKYDWIWHKNTTSGFALAKKQPLRNHEIILVFYKNQPTYNPIKEPRDLNKESIERMKYEFTTLKGTNVHQNGIKKVQFIPEDEFLSYPKTVKKWNSVNYHERVHTTQKPTPLIEYLINTYSNEGDMVHDSCMGSGSCMEACINLNRNFVGFEISNEWEWNYHKMLDRKKNMYQLSKIFKMKC